MPITSNGFQPYMEIVFLVYGFAFLAMALVIAVRYDHQSKLALSHSVGFLAGFGLMHGLVEWIDWWRIGHESFPALLQIRLGMLWLSYLLLFEFGRRLACSQLRDSRYVHWVSYWVYLPLHLLLVIVVWSGGLQLLLLDIAIRYCFGFPASLLSGLGFLLFCRRDLLKEIPLHQHSVHIACLLAAVACLAYGVVVGLIVPASDIFVANWLNQDNFIALFHFPVQLLRAVCAVLLSVAVAMLLKVFHYEAQQSLQVLLDKTQVLLRNNELILASSGEGIVGIDKEGRTLFVNDMGLKLLGFTREELIGHSLHQLTHHTKASGEPYPVVHCPMHATIQDHCRRRVDEDFLWRKDGSGFPAEYTVAPLLEGEQCLGAVTVFSDITQRKQAEVELENYRQNLESLVAERTLALSIAKEAAEAASRAKTVFLSNMSHELHTPMHAILGLTSVLQRRIEEPEHQQKLERISLATKSLLHMLDTVLDLASIESEKLSLESLSFSLGAVLDQIGSTLGIQADACNLPSRIELAPELAGQVLIGDAARLKQVLLCLIDNACKFTEEGEIVFRAWRVDYPACDSFLLHCEVQDSGVGIAQADQERIFLPFEQVDMSHTRKFGGSGLGLALTKKLVELMGGEIGICSQLGLGATFWFRIPFSLAVDDQAAPLPDHHGFYTN
jgi:two-component system sensor histidine kinase/response regulator